MRIVVFCGWPGERLRPWVDTLKETRGVTDVAVVQPGATDSANAVAAAMCWRPDFGVALGVARLDARLAAMPARGTLGVRIGAGPHAWDNHPGLWEMSRDAAEITASVRWLDDGTAGRGACAAAPIYMNDRVTRVAARADELARTLLCSVLQRVDRGDPPGDTRVEPAPVAPPPTFADRLGVPLRQAWRRAWPSLRPRLLLKYMVAAAWLLVARPVRDWLRTLRGGHRVRVFTLHRVTYLCRDGMTVAPAEFRRQMEYVQRHHDVVDLPEALALIERGAKLRRPVAAITFDDGYDSVFGAARPIMSSLGVPGACFVCPDVVDRDGRFAHDAEAPTRDLLRVMDWNAIAALRDSGWCIGSHTATHARLSTLEGDDLLRELRDSRAALRERLGTAPAVMAYPFGGPDDISREGVEAARWCGYKAVFSDFGGDNVPGATDPLALRRTDIGGDHDTLMWKVMIHGLDLRRWKRRGVAPAPHSAD